MTEQPKRSLRVRKNPKYLNSDEQDPDKVSFTQLRSPHDYSSTQAQKAHDAKILLKFINKINKNFRSHRNQLLANNAEVEKSQPLPKEKKSQNQPQTNKKGNYAAKESKADSSKKTKQMYNFKGQFSKDQQAIKNTQSYISKLKEMGSIPSVSGMGKGLYTDQLKKLQSLYPEMKNINYQTLAQNTNPNLFAGSSGGPSQAANQTKKKQPELKNSDISADKLFKRSAYHVAIAYHIYLKNLKEKGGPIGNDIDPTYYAKKLKEGRPAE